MRSDTGKYNKSHKNTPTEQVNIKMRCFIEVIFLNITMK